MLKIGITGGIGSGKTTVSKVFQALGIPVFYSDAEAIKILQSVPVRKKIKKTFGKEVFDKSEMVDRKLLAKEVFGDTTKLKKLNAIIHPAVAKAFEAWVKKNKTAPYILKEAAILFESGAHKQVDKVITVTAPLLLRIERVMKREGFTKYQVKERVKQQWSDKEKIKRSDFVIVNDEKKMIIPQVLEIHKNLALQ